MTRQVPPFEDPVSGFARRPLTPDGFGLVPAPDLSALLCRSRASPERKAVVFLAYAVDERGRAGRLLAFRSTQALGRWRAAIAPTPVHHYALPLFSR